MTFDAKMMVDLQEMAAAHMAFYRVPGCAIAVNRGGSFQSAALGFSDVESGRVMTEGVKFRIGSIGKIYTAALTFMAIQDGKLRLGESILPVLTKGRTLRLKDDRVATITVDNLLSHRSGLPFHPFMQGSTLSNDPYQKPMSPSVDSLLEFLNEVSLEENPGARFIYSSFGYTVLGRVLEQCLAMPFQAALVSAFGREAPTIARTAPDLRLPTESSYYETTTSGSPKRIVGPYGVTPYVEARDSAGGLVASAEQIARFATDIPKWFGSRGMRRLLSVPEQPRPYISTGCNVDDLRGRWRRKIVPISAKEVILHQYGIGAGSHGIVMRAPSGAAVALLFNGSDDYTTKRLGVLVDRLKTIILGRL